MDGICIRSNKELLEMLTENIKTLMTEQRIKYNIVTLLKIRQNVLKAVNNVILDAIALIGRKPKLGQFI
jgi:hypothetical protein